MKLNPRMVRMVTEVTLTNLLKNDGERIYVDLWSQGKTTESGHSTLFQNAFPCWRERDKTHVKHQWKRPI